MYADDITKVRVSAAPGRIQICVKKYRQRYYLFSLVTYHAAMAYIASIYNVKLFSKVQVE